MISEFALLIIQKEFIVTLLRIRLTVTLRTFHLLRKQRSIYSDGRLQNAKSEMLVSAGALIIL